MTLTKGKVADTKGMSIDEKDLKSTGLEDDYLQLMIETFQRCMKTKTKM